jgi:hypothetical protein
MPKKPATVCFDAFLNTWAAETGSFSKTIANTAKSGTGQTAVSEQQKALYSIARVPGSGS